MKKLTFLLALILLANPIFAQTHTSPNLDSNNVFTGENQFTQGVFVGPVTFSQLPSLVGTTNFVYVSDGTNGSNPCTGSGSGAMASYIDGAWSCGSTGGGGGGTITGVTTGASSGLQGGGLSGTLNLALLQSCSLNQVLQWNSSAWVCSTLSGAGVSSFTGDGALLSNSSSSGAVTATLTTAGAHKWWGNNTGSTATPAYLFLTAADIPTLNQNTTGNAATATALASTPSLCPTGQAPTGVLANGNATGCASIAGGGSVTSVGVSQTGSIFTITNSPITTTGNINLAFANETTNTFFAAPNGSTGTPTFRAIVAADVPTLNQNTTGSAASFTGSLSGDVTGAQSSTVVGKINGVSLAGLATGILKNTTTTGVPSIAIAADFPTLNQNTTGTAANLSGTPALPNGTTATTQTTGDNTTKAATDAFVIANAVGFVNPMTTLGDTLVENATPAPARLAGPTTPNGIPQILTSNPSSGVATAQAWAIPGVGVDLQTGTSYTIPIADDVHFLIGSNALATAWTGFALANNYSFAFENFGVGLITYTPASGTVNGNATQIIPSNYFGFHYTDNTNTYMPIMPELAAFPNCTDTGGNHLNINTATGLIQCGTTDSHNGTVTSVGYTVNGGSTTGIFSVSGSPVTTAGSLNLAIAGTSGGVAYFSSSSILSSSGILNTNVLVKGGGAGGAPTNSSITDNGTTVATTEPISIGSSPPTCAGSGAGPGCFTESTAPTAVASVDDLHADSTQHAMMVNNNNTGEMPVSRITCVNVTPVTVAANVTTDQNLMTCTIAANTLNVVGRRLDTWAAGVYSTAAASTAVLTFKVKLCTVSGCGSGTVITIGSWATAALPTVTASSFPWNIGLKTTTQTAGSTAAFESHGNLIIDANTTLGAADSVYADESAATISSIDTTAQLFMQVTVAASAGSTSNSFTQRQGDVQVLN
jgi:hypothetical protein